MKKLLLLLLIVPVISRAQIEKELILNTITIDSTKLDLVSFSYLNEIDLATHEGIIATDLRREKYETEFFIDWVTYLSLLDKKQIKRLKSEIKEVKKFKDISFKINLFFVSGDFTENPLQITYNVDGDHKFRILTFEERISIPFNLGSSIKYGRYFGGNDEIADYIDYFERPFYLETDLDGMERFIKFLQNK